MKVGNEYQHWSRNINFPMKYGYNNCLKPVLEEKHGIWFCSECGYETERDLARKDYCKVCTTTGANPKQKLKPKPEEKQK